MTDPHHHDPVSSWQLGIGSGARWTELVKLDVSPCMKSLRRGLRRLADRVSWSQAVEWRD